MKVAGSLGLYIGVDWQSGGTRPLPPASSPSPRRPMKLRHSLSGGSRDPIRLVPRFPGFLNEVLSGKGLSTVKSSVWILKTSIAIVTFLICASLHADGYHVILKLRCLNHGSYQL